MNAPFLEHILQITEVSILSVFFLAMTIMGVMKVLLIEWKELRKHFNTK